MVSCAGPPPLVDGKVPILTCFFNPTPEDRNFKLPPPQLADALLLDSAAPAADGTTRSSSSVVGSWGGGSF